VFKDKMADNGLSISSLSDIIASAFLSPNSDLDFKNEMGTDNKTASIIEHKNETKRAIKRYVSNNVIVCVCVFSSNFEAF
jgi:hypothetical protein